MGTRSLCLKECTQSDLVFLIFAQNIDYGYMLELSQ